VNKLTEHKSDPQTFEAMIAELKAFYNLADDEQRARIEKSLGSTVYHDAALLFSKQTQDAVYEQVYG